MTMRSSLFIIPILVAISTVGYGQKMSLDKCIQIALENNVQIKNNKLDIQSTDHQISEATSGLLPSVDLNGQYQYYFEVPAQVIPAASFGGAPGEYSALQLGVPQNTAANVQVSQSIYNQRVMIGLKAAKTARTMSNIQLSLTKEDIVYNVTSTYYNIQVLTDNLSLLQSNISNLEKTVKTNEALLKNDIVPTTAHKRLLINLENLHNEFENQKLNLTRYYNLLKYLMNIPLSDSVEVSPFDIDSEITGITQGDIDQRTDIQFQIEQIKLNELDQKSVEAGFYPTLTANLFYGYSGYNSEFSPFENINNEWINSSYFSLSLRVPVFDGFSKKHQVQQKSIAVQKSRNSLADLRSNAEREIQDATNNLISNKNLLKNSKRSLELAKHLFQDANIEYNNGLISVTALLEAQDDLSDARNNYSTALVNLKIAELDLKKANGQLIP